MYFETSYKSMMNTRVVQVVLDKLVTKVCIKIDYTTDEV